VASTQLVMLGTPFMFKLSEQLRYFVNKKITEDANWRDVQVVLSGHEVPGEGEHKIIFAFPRLSRTTIRTSATVYMVSMRISLCLAY
jgi:5'-3' exonuclease